MSRLVVTAALLSGALICASATALADAGNCGSAASAPALPGASNENEPRSCDTGPIQQPEPTAQPPVPPEPSDAGELPQPSAPAEMPDPIPEPPPQQ